MLVKGLHPECLSLLCQTRLNPTAVAPCMPFASWQPILVVDAIGAKDQRRYRPAEICHVVETVFRGLALRSILGT
jgi:hypothetical protein